MRAKQLRRLSLERRAAPRKLSLPHATDHSCPPWRARAVRSHWQTCFARILGVARHGRAVDSGSAARNRPLLVATGGAPGGPQGALWQGFSAFAHACGPTLSHAGSCCPGLCLGSNSLGLCPRRRAGTACFADAAAQSPIERLQRPAPELQQPLPWPLPWQQLRWPLPQEACQPGVRRPMGSTLYWN